jgi:hypothetical protein
MSILLRKRKNHNKPTNMFIMIFSLVIGVLFSTSNVVANNYNIPGHFSTIEQALTFPLYSGDRLTVVSGTQTLNSSIILPTGVSLQVNSGVTINLGNYFFQN